MTATRKPKHAKKSPTGRRVRGKPPSAFRYDCLSLTQRPKPAPAVRIFIAPVGEILQWAWIPRLRETPRAPQRDEMRAKVRSIKRYLALDDRNMVPTAIVVALRVASADLQGSEVTIRLNRAPQPKWFGLANELRPGLVIDGQHRVLGMNSYDPSIKVTVVALINPADDEVAFQFLVVNNKASKVSTDHIRALAVEYKEQELSARLQKTARLSLHANYVLVDIIDSEEDSPFYRMVDWPANRTGANPRVLPAALETALAYVQRKVADFEDQDLLVEFFLAMWESVKSAWPDDWASEKSALLGKVGIVCMTMFLADQLIARYDMEQLDITDVAAVRTATAQILARQAPEFWRVNWASASYDTKAGRQAVLDSLVQIGRNLRAGQPWHNALAILAPDATAVASDPDK